MELLLPPGKSLSGQLGSDIRLPACRAVSGSQYKLRGNDLEQTRGKKWSQSVMTVYSGEGSKRQFQRGPHSEVSE